MNEKPCKFLFITGGVCSSLGKGIVAASLGSLFEARGYRVSLTKADPYMNVDPGTMNPLQHGEVFVTNDGAETDLDLGHYERFLTAELSRKNSFSSGQIYDRVLSKERKGDYLGRTVQVIPHITDEIKRSFTETSRNLESEPFDISIIEIGGTVGDIEGEPFLEAMRQIRYEKSRDDVLFVHLTLVPFMSSAKELKTKPTQHSVRDLRQKGVQPDFICCRSEKSLSKSLKDKIAATCSVEPDCVLEMKDLDSIYKAPLYLNSQSFEKKILKLFKLDAEGHVDLSAWQRIEKSLDYPTTTCKIAVVGKYTDVFDSYKSITEALVHAGIDLSTRVEIDLVNAEKVEESPQCNMLEIYDGILVPGGFGDRGSKGKMAAIRYAREKKIPFFGICLGMQLAAIEFAQNVLNIEQATSGEFHKNAKNQIIHLMEEQKKAKDLGGTMRLGSYKCSLTKGSFAESAYATSDIEERHRHRYEFNNSFKKEFEKKGIIFSGISPELNLVEIMELKNHPWFVGVQFHPELKSRPWRAHPLFVSFLRKALEE